VLAIGVPGRESLAGAATRIKPSSRRRQLIFLTSSFSNGGGGVSAVAISFDRSENLCAFGVGLSGGKLRFIELAFLCFSVRW